MSSQQEFAPSSSLPLSSGCTLALTNSLFRTDFRRIHLPCSIQPACFPHAPQAPAIQLIPPFLASDLKWSPKHKGKGREVPVLSTALLTAVYPLGGDILKLHILHAEAHLHPATMWTRTSPSNPMGLAWIRGFLWSQFC